jgi:hypothetical protein
MGTPKDNPDCFDGLVRMAAALDADSTVGGLSPVMTEEMAERLFAEAGVLPLVENKYVFEDFRKDMKKLLKKLRLSAGTCQRYDVGTNMNDFKIRRVSDDLETHCRHNVTVTIKLIGQDLPDAHYALEVEYGIPGIPNFFAIAHVSCCTVQVGCTVHGSKDMKGMIFLMPVELAEEEHVNVQVTWTLSPDAYERFLKVTGMWLCNYKSNTSVKAEEKALKMMHGPKT